MGGKLHTFSFDSFGSLVRKAGAKRAATNRRGAGARKSGIRETGGISQTLKAQKHRFATRFHAIGSDDEVMATGLNGASMIATESLIVNDAKTSELRWLRDEYGMEIVQEGRFGKVLLQAPEGGLKGIQAAFKAAHAMVHTGRSESSHPNFLRVSPRPKSRSSGSVYQSNWGIDNPGEPGVVGADVHGHAAWTITTGAPSIRIAVLDEGVDTKHSWLKNAVVDEADFVDDNNHSIPDNHDAHGTACAGIIGSQHRLVKGLAHGCGLVGVRIAKSDSTGENWIIDDFDTADAIDWSWKEAKSSVLSNSWSGGAPTDAITRAIERALTMGRGGKGAVVVFAAGNENTSIVYPSNLDGVLTVGASNQWDKRKTPTSQDGENWWGSNFGPSLDLLAPGVSIATTDIRGAKGYSKTLFTPDFNGTSSSTPHVAAAAGLVLSVRPDLSESDVRKILIESADYVKGQAGRTDKLGHGRLNAYMAVRLARQWKP